ncbi:FAD-binding oxidoreductase [Aspergillus undulatus]|uniref:FAD-binding oxidoreductase n=1 Tax=Aspergillus undulatus TaxID=1810928 RepID=UPI003CCCA8F8
MKICPYRALSVLERALLASLRTCPADGSMSACSNPQNAQDVSLALTTLVSANDNTPQCHFAIRSGGHSTVIGSTNAEYAVTIDLSLLNSTAYNAEHQTASIGPGARWKGVYETLKGYGVAVPGNEVGLFGFTCDAIVDFEIVLPCGLITHANATYNARLFKALKGGSSNFGIVTRFDIQAFPQDPFWGGVVVYDLASTVDAQVDALVKFTDTVHEDPYGSLIPLYTYNSKVGRSVIANSLVYTEAGIEFPRRFGKLGFYDWANVSSTMRFGGVMSLWGSWSRRVGYNGHSNNFFTLTFANSPAILHKAISIQDRMIAEAKKVVKSEDWSIISLFQPLPGLFARHGRLNGGNVLGLDEGGNYILDLLWLAWDNVEDSAFFDWVGETSIAELEDFARSVGGDHSYVYLNYAAESQNPLRSYGEENLEFLSAVAAEYDPEGVLQTQVPGGFKVSRA